MTLTPPTHAAPLRTPTLEEQRDAVLTRYSGIAQARKELAREVWALRLAWGLLYPTASTREFVTWLGHGEFVGSWYAYLRAGLAGEKGLDRPELRFGELAALGERLEAGETPEQIRAAPAPPRDQTSIRVSRATADALDQTFAELSDSDTRLTRQDALETAVQAFAHAPALIRRALVHAQATGENPLDALVRAVDDRRDYRAWLARQGCVVCGVVSGVELHHAQTEPDERFRTRNRLIPLCGRHHGARVGDAQDSIHARPFAEIREDAEFWRRAFIAVSDAAEATRPGASGNDAEGERT